VVHAAPWPTQEDRRGGQAAAAQREAQQHVVQRGVRRYAVQHEAQRCAAQPAERALHVVRVPGEVRPPHEVPAALREARALHAVRVPGEVRPPHEVPAPDEGPAPREERELRGRGARLVLLHLLAYAVAPLRSPPL
jgi:hypothetical protein